MAEARIFCFINQRVVIGMEVERPPERAPPFYNTLWLKNARDLFIAPPQQGISNITFAPVYRVPADIGIDEPDRIAPFNRDLIWTVITPKAHIVSTYQKDTIGIFGAGAINLPKELKQ